MFSGSLIYRLKGFDPDGDSLRFGTLPTPGSDVIKIESISPSEANVYLNKELDREVSTLIILVQSDSSLMHHSSHYLLQRGTSYGSTK